MTLGDEWPTVAVDLEAVWEVSQLAEMTKWEHTQRSVCSLETQAEYDPGVTSRKQLYLCFLSLMLAVL